MARSVPFELQAIDRTKLYASIVERILDGIESGAFPPGAALPAERILASSLGVSRSSVREAIRVLEHAGVVDVRTGSGTYVTEHGSSKLAALRAQAAAVGEHSPLDVIAARHAVEPASAELAAAERHEHDLELLRQTLATHGRLAASGSDSAEVDLAFHLVLARATHNPVLALLVERLVEIMRRRPWSELKHATREDPSGAARDLREHAAVLAAVERGDSPAAGRAMRRHLRSVESDLLDQVE